MSGTILRPYQQSVEHQVLTLWERGVVRVIVVLPTGGGKTEVASVLARPFKNPLSVCNTRVLADQLEERLCRAATWQGLRLRQEAGEGWPYGTPDLLVVDEVHVGDSPDWQHVFEMVPPETKVLGLTATPWRFSHGATKKGRKALAENNLINVAAAKNDKYGKGLGDIFDAMIVGVKPRELVCNGYLVPLRVLNVVEAQDAAARLIGQRGPSFDEKKGEECGRIKAGSDNRLCPVDAWFKYGEGRKTIVYSHMVSAAERTCAMFQARGVSATLVHGKLPRKVVKERIESAKRGEVQVLCNVMVLTAGFDWPEASCLVIDRGANNLNTYIQMCGRGARIAEGKTDCLILDLTGCSAEHGDPQKDQDYWVVTSEGRAVSDLACEVCGTRLSPMFPQRCMKCDPFRPKLGDPKELLDTGMRVYSAMKDALAALELHTPNADPDTRDAAIRDSLEGFEAATEEEARVWKHESEAAISRMQERALLIRQEAERAAEAERRAAWEQEQARIREELAAKRQAAHNEWWAAEQQRRKEQAESYASKYRANQEAKQATALATSGAGLTADETTQAQHALTAKFRLYMQRGWSLSSATRDVRQTLPRFAGAYARDNFTVPPELKPILEQLSVDWEARTGKSLAAYELDRMLEDNRTSRFGEAWCRRKVKELFGAFEYRAGSKATSFDRATSLDSPRGSSEESRAESLDDIPF